MLRKKSIVKQTRRSFMTSLGALGVAGFFPLPGWSKSSPEEADDIPVLKAGLYLQFQASDKMTVRWLTYVPCFSWVEYGEDAGSLDQKAENVSDGLKAAFNTVHQVVLSELKSGVANYYCICSQPIEKFDPYKVDFGEVFRSPVYSFSAMGNQGIQIFKICFNS